MFVKLQNVLLERKNHSDIKLCLYSWSSFANANTVSKGFNILRKTTFCFSVLMLKIQMSTDTVI